MTHTHHANRRSAFTIIELMVAMAIAAIMVFLINRIFFDTSNAIGRGVGVSQIIGEARAANATFTSDLSASSSAAMDIPIVGPNGDGGFLFIGFKVYNNVQFPVARRIGGNSTRSVHSDQIMFVVKNKEGHRPLTPKDNTTFSPPDLSTQHALLWYGHVGRVDPNGTGLTIRQGDPGSTGAPLINGHQWIIGRQRLFLAGSSATGFHTSPPPTGTIHPDYTRADSGVPIIGPPNQRRHGFADILPFDLAYLTGATSGVLETAGSNNIYLSIAARMAYGEQRLMAATHIPIPYESYRVAQTHPIFISNCSDFQVSFAGDFDNTDGIDLDTGGNIKWYGYPTVAPGGDRPPLYAFPATARTGSTAWPIFSSNMASLPGMTNAEADIGIVFRHTSTTPQYDWPHLIRIRYRLHDERGEVESSTGANDGTGNSRTQGMWFEQIIRVQ